MYMSYLIFSKKSSIDFIDGFKIDVEYQSVEMEPDKGCFVPK